MKLACGPRTDILVTLPTFHLLMSGLQAAKRALQASHCSSP